MRRTRLGWETLHNWLCCGVTAPHTQRKHTTAPPRPLPVRYAGIGGLSEVLGWTEVQQEEKAGFMGGVAGVLGLVALILLADLALFGCVLWWKRAGLRRAVCACRANVLRQPGPPPNNLPRSSCVQVRANPVHAGHAPEVSSSPGSV